MNEPDIRPRRGGKSSEIAELRDDGPAFIAIMPPSPETSKRWYSMYCHECGTEEMMADAPGDARLMAHREEHNRRHVLRGDGEPSDEQVRAVVREVYGPDEPEEWQMDNARAALRAAAELANGKASA